MSRCPRSLLCLPTPLPKHTFYPFRFQKELMVRSPILSTNGLINLEPNEEIHKERALGKDWKFRSYWTLFNLIFPSSIYFTPGICIKLEGSLNCIIPNQIWLLQAWGILPPETMQRPLRSDFSKDCWLVFTMISSYMYLENNAWSQICPWPVDQEEKYS